MFAFDTSLEGFVRKKIWDARRIPPSLPSKAGGAALARLLHARSGTRRTIISIGLVVT